jgi:GT2 family glycosyltransferase
MNGGDAHHPAIDVGQPRLKPVVHAPDIPGVRVSAAVVIVNFNAGTHLASAVESLFAQTVSPRRIVVVDNASSDGSTAGLSERFPSLELVALTENVGFAAANNLGVRMCGDCDFVALLNPDAFPEPGWLEQLLTAAVAYPEYGFFASRLVVADDSVTLDGTGDEYHVSGLAWRRDQGAPTSVERPTGEIFSARAAAALYRREPFLAVGGFDEAFFCYYEDTDLAFRLRLAGHRCLFVSDAVVRHVGSATAGAWSEFTVYHSARNQVWAYVKNMPGPLFWMYLPQHLLAGVLITLAYAAGGEGRAALRGRRDALRELPRVLAERRRIQRERVVTAVELRRVMARGPAAFTSMLGTRAREWRRSRTSPSG